MLVSDIMVTDLVTVDIDAALQAVAGRLLDAGVGSVIVVDDGIPSGIVTETDLLRAGYQTGKPLSEIPVKPLCSEPVVTISPNKSVKTAVQKMEADNIKKLPVADGVDLVGIITLTDLVYHLSEIREEAKGLAEQHYEWTTE